MSTVRLQIRDALAALVVSATGLTVHKNLDYALEDKTLQAEGGAVAALMSGDDEADDQAGSTLNNAQEGSRARFGIHVLVAASADPEAAADSHEAAIRAAINSNPTLTGKATHVRYLGGEWDFDLGDCAIRRLVFQAAFIT